MRALLAGAVILPLVLVAACDRRMSPTSPTPFASSGQSVAPVGANPDATSHTPGLGLVTQGEQVPFKGSLEGRLTMSIPITPTLLSNLNEGSGNGTQLGRFSIRIPHVVDTTTRIGTGTYEFTAANGDTSPQSSPARQRPPRPAY